MKRELNKKKLKEVFCAKSKDVVRLYYQGYSRGATPRRSPTTTRHEGFWLLGFPPGPLHLSLANLETQNSFYIPILIPGLERTPSRRAQPRKQNPPTQTIHTTKPPRHWITSACQNTRREYGYTFLILILSEPASILRSTTCTPHSLYHQTFSLQISLLFLQFSDSS